MIASTVFNNNFPQLTHQKITASMVFNNQGIYQWLFQSFSPIKASINGYFNHFHQSRHLSKAFSIVFTNQGIYQWLFQSFSPIIHC